MAPGCLIQSLGLNGAPAVVRCGTSMATPHAAGVAMLAGQYLAAHGIAAPPPRLEEFLEANAQDVIDLRITGQPVYPRVSVDRVMDALTLGVPGGLTATASAPTSVSLQWNAVAGADGYVVHRIGEHEAALPIGSTVAPSTGFIDAAPGCGMQRYVVTARRAGLESVASQPVAYVAIECPFDAFSDGFER
jgi:subtilisin family serine protease